MLANGKTIEASLFDLIDIIYEAAIDDKAFSQFTEYLALATNSNFATLEVIDPNASNLCQFQSTGAYGLPAETIAAVNRKYGMHNPFANLVAETAKEGSVFFDTDVLKRKDFANLLYYDEFLRHYDFEYVSGLYIIHNPEISLIATTCKGRLAGAFTEDERKLFQLILPHMQKFFRIKQRLDQTSIERDGNWDAMNHLDHGAVIIDKTGRVQYANKLAREMFDSKDGLSMSMGRLTASNPEVNSTLATQLENAINAYDHMQSFQSVYDVVITRESNKRPYHLQILPLRHPPYLYSSRKPAAVVFIFDTDHKSRICVDSVARLYSLTDTEARVAALIAQGLSLEEIASELKHSVATSRTMLKRIFSKTDTHRQNELVNLLLSGLRQPPPERYQ